MRRPRSPLSLPLFALAVALPALATAAHPEWPGGSPTAMIAARAIADGPARPARRLRGVPKVVGYEVQGYVAFTFDDGPSHKTTPLVLQILDEAGIRAAFFVCGHNFIGEKESQRKNAEVLADVIARGHLVGNHTFSHVNLANVSSLKGLQQVERTQRGIEAAGGLVDGRPRLFRAPYGKLPGDGGALLRDLGFTIVKWNLDPGDWRTSGWKQLREKAVADIIKGEGGIIVLHDTKARTVKALPLILADLEAENCRRMKQGKDPILPVELDYFAVGADKMPIPVPTEVAERTGRFRDRLEAKCQAIDNRGATD